MKNFSESAPALSEKIQNPELSKNSEKTDSVEKNFIFEKNPDSEIFSQKSDSDFPFTSIEISITLSLCSTKLILWNGQHAIEREPNDETSLLILKMLLNQKRRQIEQHLERASKPTNKKQKKKNKKQNPESPTPAEKPIQKIVLSNYQSLGSGQGRIIKLAPRTRKIQKQTLSIEDL